MRTPSNRSGVPTLLVIAVPALILFLGFTLAPRAFEFRAWPEPSRPSVLDEIVARPAEPVMEVPVARVKTDGGDSLAAGGRNPRRGNSPREASLDSRGSARAGRSSRGRSRRSRDGGSSPSTPAVIIKETPAPQPAAPVTDPGQPAQLAEVPSNDQVMRPEPEELRPEQTPAPLRDHDAERDDDDWGDDDDDGRHDGRHSRGRGHGHRGFRDDD